MRRIWALVTIALTLVVTAACTADDPVVQPEVPTFEGTIDLEIGELDGDDPYLFTYIGDVAADERGRVIVADMRSSEIRVFESDGRFAFRFGGPGEGPGELTDPCCLQFGPDGELWVRESPRYSAFRLDSAGAEFRRVLRSPHPGNIGLIAPFSFGMEGELVSVGPVRNDDVSLYARLHVHPDEAVDTVLMADSERQSVGQTTVPRMFGNNRGMVYLYQPFGPRWIHAHANGGTWVEAVTSNYSVNYHKPDGTVSLIEGPALQGPTLSPDDRAWAQDRMNRERDRADLAKHPFEIPQRKPPLARMFFDRHDRLWIEKTAAAGAAMHEADVYEGTTLTARYRWPRRIQDYPAPWATESALYGVTTDSLGVQRVARVRFAPGS